MDPLVDQTMDAYGYAYNNPVIFIDPTGMAACLPGMDCFRTAVSMARGIFNKTGEILRRIEPDDININNIGINIGFGVKGFKLGRLGSISLSGSLGSITYDKNNDEINVKGPSGSVGLFLRDKDIGISLSGETFDYGIMEQSFSAINFEAECNFFNTGLSENGSINGAAHLFNFSVYDSENENKWFIGSTGISFSQNRQIDIHGTGETSPMNIIGGKMNYGVTLDFEWNMDQTISRILGGTGVVSEWKNEN